MKIMGLTGGIGSGKTTVANLLREQGLKIIDADQIARQIVEPGQPALAELAQVFGADILTAEGTLNRSLLASRAFANPAQTERLNAITHPRIWEAAKWQFEQALQAGEKWVVYDMPLLIETGQYREVDLVVVVDVDTETRVQRLVNTRGLTEEDARNRIAAQINQAKRLAVAQVVIDNNGDLAALKEQVIHLVHSLA
ncbi:dephospho-CoA kinase [Corynebacterium caspium]|uniref:dephospho-CoA kinase n=1 Tax=Corynebacterium caspium TaxID=234828 RepID=UPI00036B9941|nr:dephospho-CoA kinase [Corynebacterium caspium]WKD59382.1 Dephospho-CoA kinase [Corynebacterium caspium DSM 44850]